MDAFIFVFCDASTVLCVAANGDLYVLSIDTIFVEDCPCNMHVNDDLLTGNDW